MIDIELERLRYSRAELESHLALVIFEPDLRLDVEVLKAVLSQSLPPANRVAHEDYEELLQDLTRNGVLTVGNLKWLLERQLNDALAKDTELVELERARITKHKQIAPIDRETAERLKKGVFATHTGLVRVMIEYEFNPFYRGRRNR